MYCIVGKSGAGKSTLLSLISGLDRATNGVVIYGCKDLRDINCDDYREKNICVIFQDYNLLTNCSAAENIVIADEPTGNLNGETAKGIMDIFVRLAKEESKCAILVTHSKEVAAYAD